MFVSTKYCWEGISTKWSTERRGRRPLWVLRAEFMPSLRLTRTWVAVWRLGVCASRSAPSRHRETQGCPHVPPSVAGGRRLEGWPLLLTLIAGMDTETCGTLQDLKIWHRHWIETSQGKTDWRLVDHRSLGLSKRFSATWLQCRRGGGQLPVSCGLEPPNNLRPEEARCQSVKPLLCQLAAHQGGGADYQRKFWKVQSKSSEIWVSGVIQSNLGPDWSDFFLHLGLFNHEIIWQTIANEAIRKIKQYLLTTCKLFYSRWGDVRYLTYCLTWWLTHPLWLTFLPVSDYRTMQN